MSASDRAPRHFAIAVPARDEEDQLSGCLTALDAAAACYGGPVSVMVVANNCRDGTVAVLRQARLRHARLHWSAVSLLPEVSHAGWARRIALDGTAAILRRSHDVLASTDADTCVAPNWIVRTVAHLDEGAEAVAGRALTRRADRAALGAEAVRRLNLLGRYFTAVDWLRAHGDPEPDDRWPRHFYEGGASMALTLDLYRRIGGAPTPPLGEDRALFAAVRAVGGRVRHPLDVRVFTSSRTQGRAPGGMADAFAQWIAQPADMPLHEAYAFPAALDPDDAGVCDRLTFRTLPGALSRVRQEIRVRRSAAVPKVETIRVPSLFVHAGDRVAQQPAQLGDRFIA